METALPRRIKIGKDTVEQYGGRFAIVRARGEIVLIPLPDDPIESLQKEGAKIPKHLTLRQLKEMVRRRATKEALGNWNRLQRLRRIS